MNTITYHTTYVNVHKGKPVLIRQGEELELVSGQELHLGDVIHTRNARLVIKDNNGLIVYVGEESEIEYDNVPFAGPGLIGYGRIFKQRLFVQQPINSQGPCFKYRTSCWACSGVTYMTSGELNQDIIYAFYKNTEIWEYDEHGERFTIVDVPEGYKATLRYDEAKLMRERYIVSSLEPISQHDYRMITENYLNPGLWRDLYPEVTENT